MGMMKRRMLRGDLYRADDPELVAEHSRAQTLLELYNRTRHGETGERQRLLHELLGAIGDDVIVKPPFRCDYGTPVSIGTGTSINYGCTMLDVAPIKIGSDCRFGPDVQLLAATHPIDPGPRRAGWERGEPISIHDNVWLGGRVLVCPGVKIGEDTVVGAGSVVTRDLPSGVLAFGTPATVQREIGERDLISVPSLETS